MEVVLPCCGGRSAAGKDPPFRRVVALDYYDGPTAGVAECAVCSVEFRFEMIDQSTRRDVRAFSLAPLPGGSVEMVVAACPQGLPPQWPVWVPRWEFLSEADRAASEQRIEQILEKAGPPQHAVAWSDITKGLWLPGG